MKNNIIFKFIASIPVVLITLYFIPFLGVCLILFRYFMYSDKRRVSTPVILVLMGLLILVPKILSLVLEVVKFDINKIPYLNDIINTEFYNVELINYSKFLITVGIIFLILSFVLKTIFDKVASKFNSGFRSYVEATRQRDYEIAQKNDLEIKIKQEKARNTNYVKCPKCGSDNLVSERTGVCKYCRGILVNKGYKS